MLTTCLCLPQPRHIAPLPRLLLRLLLVSGRRQPLLLPPLVAPPHQRILQRHRRQLLLGQGRKRVAESLQNQRVLQGEPGQVRAANG